MSGDKEGASIVIRRVKKVVGGGHHGGAWKVAYADFVTAMMAFFLVMWLVGSTTNKEKAAISEYFKNPSAVPGHSASPTQGPNGPGGASNSMIKMGGTAEAPHGNGNDQLNKKNTPDSKDTATPNVKEALDIADHKRLESLFEELKEALDKSQALEPFKDQLLLDIISEGLCIQIVDKQNRPMFSLGAASLQPYTMTIMKELAQFINAVPNRISITGHTDIKPFPGDGGYTNWELSADRANAARRALIAGGMDPNKIVRVVGLASSVLFDKTDPYNPINRRISIVIMSHQAEMQALGEEIDKAVGGGQLPPAASSVVQTVPATPATDAQTPAAVPAPATSAPAAIPAEEAPATAGK